MRKLKHAEIERIAASDFRDARKHPVTVIAQDVRSIHNVGSMFRTADAAAIERMVLAGITGTPENRAIRKTALGAEETVTWQYADDLPYIIDNYRTRGYTIAALELTDTPRTVQSLTAAEFPLVLIVGNEVHGVPEEIVADADLSIEIPQYGTKQSLNVAVAFGIAIFGVVERYRALVGRAAPSGSS